MKNFNLIICLLTLSAITFFFNSCDQEPQKAETPPTNYIVLLDLSDRLLSMGQVEKDKSMVKEISTLFEKKVRQNLTILSKDKIKVRLLPQEKGLPNQDHYEDLLSLDMTTIPTSDKNNIIKQYMSRFDSALNAMYTEALVGQHTVDYKGVDIWKYFKDELASDLDQLGNNKVIILTDGYLDFEDYTHTTQNGNLFSHSKFFSHPELSGNNWKQKAEEKNFGFIPVEIPQKFELIVLGIKSKNNDLYSEEKIKYFWEKWMRESVSVYPTLVLDASVSKMKTQVNQFLQLKQ